MALPSGVIILFIIIGCILILLFIVGYICKKYLRGDFQTKREIDDADEPLLEDCYDEFVGQRHETKRSLQPESKQLNSSEAKTADQIRQKYRKDKTETSSQASSSRKGSNSSLRDGGGGITTSLLEKASNFSSESSTLDTVSQESAVDRIPAWQATLIEEEPTESESSNPGTEFSPIDSQSPLQTSETHPPQTQNAQPPPPYTQHLHPHSLPSSFAGEASIILTLKYLETTNLIIGTIKKLENANLNAKGTPRDICFHMKLLPKGKHRMKTPWRASSTDNLSLTFTMGPIKVSRMLHGVLCLRLYGRLLSSRFARPKCHGECTITLNQLLGKDGEIEMNCQLSSKGLNKSTEDLRFTTDDEGEFP